MSEGGSGGGSAAAAGGGGGGDSAGKLSHGRRGRGGSAGLSDRGGVRDVRSDPERRGGQSV